MSDQPQPPPGTIVVRDEFLIGVLHNKLFGVMTELVRTEAALNQIQQESSDKDQVITLLQSRVRELEPETVDDVPDPEPS